MGKAFATIPDNLVLISVLHGGGREPFLGMSSDLHMHCVCVTEGMPIDSA